MAQTPSSALATYSLHDGETLTVTRREPDLLEAAAEWAPKAVKPFVHSHPKQDERFEIHEGELTVKLDGTEHVVRAGQTFDVPRGTVHAMWNSGDGPCRATWQVRPALDTEGFWRAVHEARQQPGTTGRHGILTAAAAAPILLAHRDEIRLPIPEPVQRVALGAMAATRRLRRR